MDRIKYFSTNLRSEPVSFGEALLAGQAPDKGLYMPNRIPLLTPAIIDSLSSMSYAELATGIIGAFIGDETGMEVVGRLAAEAYDFDVPLEHAGGRRYIMRLDRGPTASFKDFAARMMARLMSHYLGESNRELLIITATSGDTGSAIANAFFGVRNIRVLVLFPEEEVTIMQRKQMTTLGGNISVAAVKGKFDDCQAMAKQAFSDEALSHFPLSSANSINIGRLIPQAVYYFWAWSRLAKMKDDKALFVVPSGNFGDMMGGMLAWRMGLPVSRFIIAVNGNDEFPEFLDSMKYRKVEPSANCISSAMNVGHPSNLARLVSLYGGVMDEKGNISKEPDFARMRNEIYSVSISDEETRNSIREAWEKEKILLEPHGAVGWAGMKRYFSSTGIPDEQLIISLETAHPAKFPEHIRELTGIDPELPPSLEGIEDKEESYASLSSDYNEFREFLKKNY